MLVPLPRMQGLMVVSPDSSITSPTTVRRKPSGDRLKSDALARRHELYVRAYTDRGEDL